MIFIQIFLKNFWNNHLFHTHMSFHSLSSSFSHNCNLSNKKKEKMVVTKVVQNKMYKYHPSLQKYYLVKLIFYSNATFTTTSQTIDSDPLRRKKTIDFEISESKNNWFWNFWIYCLWSRFQTNESMHWNAMPPLLDISEIH